MAWYEEPRILLSGLAFIVLTPILIVLIVQSDKAEKERKNRPPEEDYIDLRFEEGGEYQGETPEQREIHRTAAREQLSRYREMEHGIYD